MANKLTFYRGALLGMAVGDAMGNTVDKKTLAQICEDYGPNGLLGYDLVNGYADVTSYTQVAAFAANGLLLGMTRGQMQGKMAPLVRYVNLALREWSRSQHYCTPERNFCWLSSQPELKRRHCMDNRMLDALNRPTQGTMEEPTNRSNHPGGLTEAVAVVLAVLELNLEQPEIDRLAAECIALTHGDPEAFLSGAALAHGISMILRNPDLTPTQIVMSTMDAVQLEFGRDYAQTTHIWELLGMAQTLADSDTISPRDAMEQLRCVTAAEVLAGALYACLTCHGDFDTAMITAVNHSGRSAAVGAVTGALLGARMGAEALPEFYMDCLEPTQTLRELADDLAQGCPMERTSLLFDGDWDRKYRNAGS